MAMTIILWSISQEKTEVQNICFQSLDLYETLEWCYYNRSKFMGEI